MGADGGARRSTQVSSLALTGTCVGTMAADHAFEIDSTVGRYWLVNGSGFELVERGGRSLGVVEDVVVDPSTQRVDAMVVRRHATIRRARVPPEELTAVVPAAKVFVIASGSSEALPPTIGRRIAMFAATSSALARERWPGVRRRIAVFAAKAVELSRRAVVAAALGVHRAWRWLREREQVDRGRRARGGRTTRRSG